MEGEEEIRQIAYYIWEQEGCCDGHDIEHWTRAEVIWKEKQKPAESRPPEKPVAVSQTVDRQNVVEAKPKEKLAPNNQPSGRKKSSHKRQ